MQAQQLTFPRPISSATYFNRQELREILALYGRKVAAGEWRDYAIDFGREKAVFSAFRRASEVPLYRIEKCPKLARRQGAYSVVTATGLILKRGNDLEQGAGRAGEERAAGGGIGMRSLKLAEPTSRQAWTCRRRPAAAP